MNQMKRNRIETGIHYLPIHKMHFYNKKQKLPITEKVTKQIVSIPIHPSLDESDIDKIIKTANQFRGPMWSKDSDGNWHNAYWDVIN